MTATRTAPAAVQRFARRIDAVGVEAAHRQFSILTINPTVQVVAWHEDGEKVRGCYIERRTTPTSEWRCSPFYMSMKKVEARLAGEERS